MRTIATQSFGHLPFDEAGEDLGAIRKFEACRKTGAHERGEVAAEGQLFRGAACRGRGENRLKRECGQEYKRILGITFSSSRKIVLTLTDRLLIVCEDAPNFVLDFCTEQWMEDGTIAAVAEEVLGVVG